MVHEVIIMPIKWEQFDMIRTIRYSKDITYFLKLYPINSGS